MTDLLWPRYSNPGDLAAIESIPLAERGFQTPRLHCSHGQPHYGRTDGR